MLHARIHPLLLFYIDGSSGLQQDDANMHLLLLVKYVEDKPVGVLGMLTYFEYAPLCNATALADVDLCSILGRTMNCFLFLARWNHS